MVVISIVSYEISINVDKKSGVTQTHYGTKFKTVITENNAHL